MTQTGDLLREARTSAGLSIRALSGRAGIAASTISRIESARISPTFETMERLLAASGRTLNLSAAPICHGLELASLADAWTNDPIAGVSPDFTKLRTFTDHLLLHPEEREAAIQTPPPPSGSDVMDNLLAAIAETIAGELPIEPPAWTKATEPLDTEWALPGTPKMLARWRRETPETLHRRGLIVDRDSLWREPATVGL